MTSPTTTIIGGGLAGLLCAEAMCERGMDAAAIHILDAGGPRASENPGALLHALPGRSLFPRDGTMDAFTHAVRWATRWRARMPDAIWRGAMIRPDFGEDRGQRTLDTFEQARRDDAYPDIFEGVALTGEEARAHAPAGMRSPERFVRYGPAFCVLLREVCAALRDRLIDEGVHWHKSRATHIEHYEGCWHIHHDATPLASDRVVLAIGPGLVRWFPNAPLRVNGGELLVASPPENAAPLKAAISGGGHIAPRPDGCWVYGASYLRPQEDAEDPTALDAFARSDEEAIAQIHELIGRFYPPVTQAKEITVWRGRRCVYLTDHQPLVGAVPGADKGLYVLSALGSKGLLWTPYAAHRLAAVLDGAKDASIPSPLRADRMPQRRWTSPHIQKTQ